MLSGWFTSVVLFSHCAIRKSALSPSNLELSVTPPFSLSSQSLSLTGLSVSLTSHTQSSLTLINLNSFSSLSSQLSSLILVSYFSLCSVVNIRDMFTWYLIILVVECFTLVHWWPLNWTIGGSALESAVGETTPLIEVNKTFSIDTDNQPELLKYHKWSEET